MFDLSWSELLVIAVVAIVFIGPKELPSAIRLLGKWMGKARALARDFQTQVDDVVREAELDELRKEADKYNPKALLGDLEKNIDPTGQMAEALQPPSLPSLSEPVVPPSPPPVSPSPVATPPSSAVPAAVAPASGGSA